MSDAFRVHAVARPALRPPIRGRALAGTAAAATGALLGVSAAYAAGSGSKVAYLLLAGLVALCATMCATNLRRFLLGVVVIELPLQWDVNLGYRAELADRGAIGGVAISPTTVALVILLALWVADLLTAPRSAARPAWRASAPVLVYVALTVASIVVARDRGLAVNGLFVLVQSLALLVYVASNIRTRADVRFLAGTLLASLAIAAFALIAIGTLGIDLSAYGLGGGASVSGPGATRYGGTVGSPNTAASFLATLLPLALAYVLARRGGRPGLLVPVSLALGALALLLTFSRGGWIAFAVAFAVAAVLLGRARNLATGRVVLVLLVVIAFAAPFAGSIAERVSDGGTAADRATLADLAGRVIRDHPLRGVGANNFAAVLPDYGGPEFGGSWIYVVHTKYLLVWAEAGALALAAFVWFLVATARSGLAAARSPDRELAIIGIGLVAAFAGQVVHMGVDIFQSRPQVQSLFLVAGFLIALRRLAALEEGRE